MDTQPHKENLLLYLEQWHWKRNQIPHSTHIRFNRLSRKNGEERALKLEGYLLCPSVLITHLNVLKAFDKCLIHTHRTGMGAWWKPKSSQRRRAGGVRQPRVERRARRRRQHYCQGWNHERGVTMWRKLGAELGYSRISCEHAQKGNGSGFPAVLPLTAVKTTSRSGPFHHKEGQLYVFLIFKK